MVNALASSTQLVQTCEAWGCLRYWVAGHYNTSSYAVPGAEAMVVHIAKKTRCNRVGSGGVMLCHYSPLKVGESST